jgi:trehalose 6-phosphate synthase/phosphatase
VSLAWHYRLADREFGSLQARELRAHLAHMNTAPLEVVAGHQVVEVRPVGVNKSLVLSHVETPEDGFGLVVAIGDDMTDEDLFAALPEDAVTVRVGTGSTRAGVHVADYAAVRRLLQYSLEPVGHGR